jgi:heme-degrading monooxygenase HmoA
MIGVIVTFQYQDDFDRERVEKVAAEAAPRFEGLPGLRSKAFTVDVGNERAVNFYVWDSEEAARMFFNEQLVERVTGLYGVSPIVDFVEVAELVDNRSSDAPA